MKTFITVLSVTIILILSSCTRYIFPENQYHIFTGKSEWTESEKESCYTAISNLKGADSTYIIFRKSNIKSMGQAQPLIRTIFKPAQKRTYIIRVRDKKVNSNLCFETIPDSAKVGLTGHEIVHVLDYKTKNFFQIVTMSFKYSMCKNYKRKIEWQTDSLAIVNNMGYEILCFTNHIYNSPFISKKYLHKKEKFYMKPEDIIRVINSTE